jgi:hypothetical protein
MGGNGRDKTAPGSTEGLDPRVCSDYVARVKAVVFFELLGGQVSKLSIFDRPMGLHFKKSAREGSWLTVGAKTHDIIH